MLINKEDWFTVPNILSYIRILLIPLYIYLYLNAVVMADYYWAAGILLLSGATDALDGIIARSTGQITALGKLIDPLADKLTQVAVIATMFLKRPYILSLLILFIVKELFMLLNNLILFKKNIIMDGSKWFGKVATAIFYVCMFILVVFPMLDKKDSMPLITLTTIFQVIALLGYGTWFKEMFQKSNLKK